LERSDEEIITLCRKAKNAHKFEALFDHGDTRLYDGDESRADEALACMLAFYTKDAAQLERLMNASALGRRENGDDAKITDKGPFEKHSLSHVSITHLTPNLPQTLIRIR
jgi:primase-polymerase (primpol)-like protein